MERKKYLQEKMESEKGQLKTKLWRWGQSVERCLWKEEELQKLKGMYEIQKRIWEGIRTEKGKEMLLKCEETYMKQMQQIKEELNEIVAEKTLMDERIKKLEREEEVFLRMRFEKGYGFDYIAIKMHLSRATIFRIQDRALKKLLEMES